MICSKCGAPVPAGMSACPYCGAKCGAAPRRQAVDEETSFAEVDEEEFSAREDDKTEFAGNAWTPAPPAEEETEYVQQPPVQTLRRGAGNGAPKAPAGRRKKVRKEKQRKPQKAKKQPEQNRETGHNNVLRIVLVAVLAVLIVLLVLRG